MKNLSFKHLFHLIIDNKIIRIFGQEVSELLDVLSGDMANFGRSLGSVAKQALDGDLGANAVLLQPLLEVFHSLSGIVPATVVAFVLEEKKRFQKCQTEINISLKSILPQPNQPFALKSHMGNKECRRNKDLLKEVRSFLYVFYCELFFKDLLGQ